MINDYSIHKTKYFKLFNCTFQSPKVVSPSQDILWLFYTCVERDVRREQQWALLLEYYYAELKNVVEELGDRLRGTYEVSVKVGN